MSTLSTQFGDIKVSAVPTGDGHGFLDARSKDEAALNEVAALTAKIPTIEQVMVEWVEPFTYTRTDGTTSRTIGGYWKMVATF